MNKTLSNTLIPAASRLSVDSIVAPITNIGGKLRDLSKAKAEEAGRLQWSIADVQQEIRDLLDESDRAFRIAEKLDGMVL